jgi:nucleoside-diphosphate-sugar epimerase
LTKGAYDAACSNAQAVIHAAAQVDPSVIEDPWKDMVEPSTRGVDNILSSCDKHPAIRAFIQTSSMVRTACTTPLVDHCRVPRKTLHASAYYSGLTLPSPWLFVSCGS